MPTITPIQDQEVEITEQGTLKLEQDTVTFGGTGFKYIDLEVPAGKKWIFKKAGGIVVGTTTVNYRQFYVRTDTGDNMTVERVTSVDGSNFVVDDKFYDGLTLPEGWVIRLGYNVTADTDGVGYLYLLVQELDA